MVWSVYSSQCLQQIVSVQTSTQIEFLQTGSIEPSQKHLIDNQDID